MLAQPVTGRSHQIRLHLQFLNHPIANDSKYGGDNFYKNEMGRDNHDFASEKLNEIDENNRERNGVSSDKGCDKLSHMTFKTSNFGVFEKYIRNSCVEG